MARVASCPQCDHELLVPNEAGDEAWAKCPECRAFFQVKQAASRDLPALLIVEADQAEIETQLDSQVDSGSEYFAPQAESAEPANELDLSADDNLDLDLDDMGDEPKAGDDLEAAAQRIDEWFRSARTVPDAPPVNAEANEDDELAMVSDEEEIDEDFAPTSAARTNATIDLDAGGIDDLAASADFDLDDPIETPGAAAAWDDSERMEDLLNDIEVPSSEEFVAAVTHDEDPMDVESAMRNEDRPPINMFADEPAPEVKKSKSRKPRRKRSLVRSLLLTAVAGLFGAVAGYYVLMWIQGPSGDFLQVAKYLPQAVLPSSFQEPKQIARNTAPPVSAPDTTAEAAPADTEVPAQPEEPQDLAPATEDTAEIGSPDEMPADTAATEETPATDGAEQPAEVQAGYTEAEQSTGEVAPAVGDRYAMTDATESDVATTDPSTATDLTAEKPATEELTTDELPADEPATTESTDLTTTEPTTEEPAITEPATDEPALTDFGATEPSATETPADEPAATEPAITEPAPLDPPAADSLFGETETVEVAEWIEPVKITGAPSFSADDLRTSLETAVNAQPQLATGNFADGKEVQKAKGFGFSMLADLAQKATFVEEAAKADATQLEKDTDELFRKTLADTHIRGEVAQILPKWMASPNRKHGGVFFGGHVASHESAGSVVECKVELDGGQTLTILTPAGTDTLSLESTKPMAIVGWIVDKPKEQVDGYTGSATQAIFASKLIPLE